METVLLKCAACGAVNRVQKNRLTEKPKCGKCKKFINFPRTPVDATSSSFQREVISEPGRVLVDFWSPMCGHCLQLNPVIDDISGQLAGALKVVKINVLTERDLAMRFNITGVPTMILFKGGKKIKETSGALPKNQLLQWIQSA